MFSSTKISIVLLCACLTAGGLWLWLHPAQPPQKQGDSVQLAFLTDLGGITAPCGCTSRPLGGLDKLALLLQTQQDSLLGWISAGNTFFEQAEPSDALQGHARRTAGIIAEILARLRPSAVALGPNDCGVMAGHLAALPAPTRINLHLPNQQQAGALLPQTQILRQAGTAVGIIAADVAIARQADGGCAAWSASAAALRAQGAQGVVLAWPLGTHSARSALGTLHGVDIVVAGSPAEPKAPEALGEAMLLDAGARGEYLGMLQVTHTRVPTNTNASPKDAEQPTDSRWQWFDGGEAERAQLQQSHDRFAAEVARMPEGPGRSARQARLVAIAEQMAQIQTTPPPGTSMRWRLLPIEQDLPAASWATEALARYNDGLCETAYADTAARVCTPAASDAATYVGSATCQGCHSAAWEVYQRSQHAHAWATLTQAHKACDLGCVGCHVVGWEQPGGFCHLQDAEPFVNVGCESCHGPGKGHIENPLTPSAWAKNFVRNTPEATCRGCHNAEHSDQFDFSTYRPRILGPGHGMPLTAEP